MDYAASDKEVTIRLQYGFRLLTNFCIMSLDFIVLFSLVFKLFDCLSLKVSTPHAIAIDMYN